ncbi:hypothetical protein [Poriferisphaera sp. WC338]|uniref:hypothetical protein n=1 Tax=Poriferisphaera sp. WC338 TaxID=3425129 RepID=UPI003D817738
MCKDVSFLSKLPEREVYKEDNRSRVWLVEHEGIKYVIKRFEYARWRQIIGWLVHLHSGKIEVRKSKQLAASDLPVEKIIASKMIGGRAHLVSLYLGKQIFEAFNNQQVVGYQDRTKLIESISHVMRDLIDKGYVFRDCKLSNMILRDEDHSVCLIDVGSFRRFHSNRRHLNMLRILDDTAKRANISRAERLRAARAMHLSSKEIRMLVINPKNKC